MEQSLIPYSAVKSLGSGPVVVLAPHPDDEVFGCGGAIMRHVSAGDMMRVIIATSGGHLGDEADENTTYIRQRQQESINAAHILGYGEPIFWGLPDRGLYYGEELVSRISEAIQENGAQLVYAPSIYEMHPDHRALGMSAVEAVRLIGNGVLLAMYEVGVPLPPNRLLDITDLLDKKRQAIRYFVSQLANQPYDKHIEALNCFRTYTLPPEVEAAEGYLVLDGVTLDEDLGRIYASEAQRQQHLEVPMDAFNKPLVSVIVRTMGRKELTEALDSIALQTYPRIEVVVVDARGTNDLGLSQWCGRFPLRMRSIGQHLDRSAAANLGLDEATGDYLIFLDDDDLFFADHITNLVAVLENHEKAKAAYAGIRVVHILPDGSVGPVVDLNEDFDLRRLQVENFLPIHAVLFDRALLRHGCRFDETLDRYEDWDFWLQIARYTPFVHVNRVSACYRNRGASGFGVDADSELIHQARGRFFDKWKPQWSGERLGELLDYLKNEAPPLVAVRNELTQLRHELTEQEQQVIEKERQFQRQILDKENQLTDKDRQLIDKDRQLIEKEEQLTSKNSQLSEKDRDLASKERQLADKDRLITEIYQSTSWRITYPLRWLKFRVREVSSFFKLLTRSIKKNGGGFRGLFTVTGKLVTLVKRHGLKTMLIHGLGYLRADSGLVLSALPLGRPVSTNTCLDHLMRPHTANVTIVICVHNALEDVRCCLSSVVRYTLPPYDIVLVDDGSADPTRECLEQFSINQGAQLIRNEQARGYTLAANQGMRAAQGDYVILLNSDTVVAEGWLDRMITCAESDSQLGVIGPLSNTASWQSIPEVRRDDDWATNELPEGISVNEMANLVALRSGRLYPRMGFLNGFCLLIRRETIEEIGYFDEQIFAQGYGEENDYCLRVRKAGRTLAVADDVFIYHSQSKSYSNERRNKLVDQAGKMLAQKHGQPIIDQGVAQSLFNPVIEGIRAHARHLWARQRLIDEARSRWEGQQILVLLPVMDAGGGGNVVFSELRAMIRMGVDARVLNLFRHRELFERYHPDLDIPVIYATSEDEIPHFCQGFDAVVATAYLSVDWLVPLTNSGQAFKPSLGYYIQDFEPYFYASGSVEYKSALASYNKLPEINRFCKTEWNRAEVKKQSGAECAVVGPSVELDLFRPRPAQESAWPQRPLRIAAMIRPISPRRAARLTMEVLRTIQHRYGETIEIILFGTDEQDPDFRALPRDFAWKNVGKQTPTQLALLFSEVDIFVDCSTYQAMGLTAMEAMACGTTVIVPATGGANSFAMHERNALIVDTKNPTACQNALERLINDADLRLGLRRQAMTDIAQYYPEAAAFRILEILLPDAFVGRKEVTPGE